MCRPPEDMTAGHDGALYMVRLRHTECAYYIARSIMQQRKLGTQGLTVSALGLGCMGMTWAYGTDRNFRVSPHSLAVVVQ